MGHKAEGDFVETNFGVKGYHGVASGGKHSSARVESVARGDSDDWLVGFGDVSLETVKLLDVITDSCVVIFFFHVGEGAEVCAIAEVLVLVRPKVDHVDDSVDVHGGDAAGDLVDHA